MSSHQDKIRMRLHGHLKIIEYDDEEAFAAGNGNVVLNRRNAIDRENAALMFARALTDRPNGTIYYMSFGNGGATVDPLGNVVLSPPVVNSGNSADLYNLLFNVIVDSESGAFANSSNAVTTGTGSVTYIHTVGTTYSDVIVSAIVGKNEPFGFLEAPVGSPATGTATLNEIGLKLADDKLVTHVTFTPIVKKATSILEVLYTLRIFID